MTANVIWSAESASKPSGGNTDLTMYSILSFRKLDMLFAFYDMTMTGCAEKACTIITGNLWKNLKTHVTGPNKLRHI